MRVNESLVQGPFTAPARRLPRRCLNSPPLARLGGKIGGGWRKVARWWGSPIAAISLETKMSRSGSSWAQGEQAELQPQHRKMLRQPEVRLSHQPRVC